jgi:hypothetical protein
MADYKIVGYVSKAGKLGTYKHTATAKNKFGEGNRVLLESFGSEPVKFWTDENKLVAAPPAAATAARRGKRCSCGDCSECEWNDDQNYWTPENPVFSRSAGTTVQFDENDAEILAE